MLNFSSDRTNQLLSAADAELRAGRYDGAERLFRETLLANPASGRACTGLGVACMAQRRLEEAAAAFRRAIALQPVAEAYLHLGQILSLGEKTTEGAALLAPGALAFPDDERIAAEYARALGRDGQSEAAVRHFEKSLQRWPGSYLLTYYFGALQLHLGNLALAEELARRAIGLQPRAPEPWMDLGVVLQAKRDPAAAAEAFRQVLAVMPGHIKARGNLAGVLLACGDCEGALSEYRRAMMDATDDLALWGMYLFALSYSPNTGKDVMAQAFSRYGALVAKACPVLPAVKHDHNPDRPLRIGYVSGDFRDHPAGRLLASWFGRGDRATFHVTCYSNDGREDEYTRRIRSAVDAWRDISHMGDAQAAQLVRHDRIDILVDLAMHTAGGRPLLFARKPAPVQAAYLAYCGTTGMATMDYRVSDPHLDPATENGGVGEPWYSERTIRLPATYWCYAPPEEAAPLAPRATREGITFGCLNNAAKISPEVVDTWARVLNRVPRSRLVLRAPDGPHREGTVQRFAGHGIDASRIQFHNRFPYPDFFRIAQGFDIALDPFPFCGGITTCDTLWSGVPVVTLRGGTAIARGGVSILSNIGLPELIAESTDRYVEIAVALASQPARLDEWRLSMRSRMLGSPLMDAPRFARDMESAFRTMWRVWCKSIGSTAAGLHCEKPFRPVP